MTSIEHGYHIRILMKRPWSLEHGARYRAVCKCGHMELWRATRAEA